MTWHNAKAKCIISTTPAKSKHEQKSPLADKCCLTDICCQTRFKPLDFPPSVMIPNRPQNPPESPINSFKGHSRELARVNSPLMTGFHGSNVKTQEKIVLWTFRQQKIFICKPLGINHLRKLEKINLTSFSNRASLRVGNGMPVVKRNGFGR